jgi:hypothetical protein
MDRRRFMATIGGALACPAIVRAQAPKEGPTRRIGFLLPDREPNVPRHQRGGSVALRERGWIEDENLRVERAFANNDLSRLPELAKAMVQKRVDIIVSVGSEQRWRRRGPPAGFPSCSRTSSGLWSRD